VVVYFNALERKWACEPTRFASRPPSPVPGWAVQDFLPGEIHAVPLDVLDDALDDLVS
jgi:hypothetical protein